jgi:hypothetical protein
MDEYHRRHYGLTEVSQISLAIEFIIEVINFKIYYSRRSL